MWKKNSVVLIVTILIISATNNILYGAVPTEGEPVVEPSSTADEGAVPNTGTTSQSSAIITDQKVFASVEKLNVDPTTGTANLNIPFDVPPGRAGIQPNIALLYNSGSANGIAGMGWIFELGNIQRSTKKGVPKYDSSDTFVLIQAGSSQELVYDASVGFYRSKIEGAFMKIQLIDPLNGWVVTDKKGTKYYFGQNQYSKQADSERIFKWALDRVEDISGNFMLINYVNRPNPADPPQVDEIIYTGHVPTGLQPFATVKFNYISRPDNIIHYSPGFKTTIDSILQAIDVNIGSTLVRRYKFNYTPDIQTNRSFLTNVTQFSNDQTSSLPSTVFSYSQNNTNIDPPIPLDNYPVGHIVSTQHIRLLDMNADGLPDFLESDSPQYRIYFNNGNFHFSNWVFAINSPTTLLNDPDLRMADFNGDGLQDFVYGQSSSYEVWLNNGQNGFHPKVMATYHPGRALGGTNEIQFMDMNGDGFADLLDTNGGSYKIYYSNGSGDFSAVANATNSPSYPAESVRFTDINGDSLLDVVNTNNWQLWINNGQNGYNLPTTISLHPQSGFSEFADMNADGLTDILNGSDGIPYRIYTNNGQLGFATPIQAINQPALSLGDSNVRVADMNADGLADIFVGRELTPRIPYQVSLNNGNNGFHPPVVMDNWPAMDLGDLGLVLVDLNKDGLTDLLKGAFPYQVWPQRQAQSNSSRSGVLVHMDNGIGATTDIRYDNLPVGGFPPIQFRTVYSPVLINTVKSITTTVSGQSYVSNYEFKNGFWDQPEREFRGFGIAKVIDPDGNYSETTFAQDDTFKGRPLRQETRDSGGNLFSKTENIWDVQEAQPGVKFVFLKQKDDFIYDGNATGRRTQEKYFYEESPQLGNMTKAISMGEVDLNSGADIGSDTRTVETEYHNNTQGTNWLCGLPKRTIVKDNAGTMVRQSWLYYDGSESQATLPVQGLLTKQELWAGSAPGAVNPVTRYSYDTYGNLKTTTDPNNNVAVMTYDTAYQLFPLKAKNALNHEVVNEYYGVNGVLLDSGDGYKGLWGQLKSTTDPNNQQGRKSYDVFGRAVATVSPLDSIQYPTTTMVYEYTSSFMKVKTLQRKKSGQPGTYESVSLYDGLGRLIQSKTESEVTGRVAVSGQTEYNSRGLPNKKYLPFFSVSPIESLEPIDSGKPKTTLTYDAVGRVIQTANPNGTYATAGYDDWENSSVDENGHKQKSVFDAYGRLIQKIEYRGADGRSPFYPASAFTQYTSTQYAYDSEGNLIQTQDAQGNVTAISYDSLGRKASMNDPDMGVWQYAYDAAGNLKSQTDAKARKIDFTYDALHRLANKTSGIDLNVNYTYDDPFVTNAKGRLTKAGYDLNGDTKFSYDIMGRENESKKKIDGLDYNVKRSYDALSRLQTLEYPDGKKIIYEYNAAGQVTKVYEEAGQGTSQSPLSAPDPQKSPSPTDIEPMSFRFQDMGRALCRIFGQVFDAILGVEDAYAQATTLTLNPPVAGNGQVSLSWSGSLPAGTSYRVYYGTSSGNYSNTVDVGLVTSYTVTGLTNGTTYYFRVGNISNTNPPIMSNEVSATPQGPPLAPVLNTAVAGNAQVQLSWGAVTGATGYKVKYGLTSGTYTTTLSIGNVTSYAVTGLINGKTYYFVVIATNTAGTSPNSNQKSAIPTNQPFTTTLEAETMPTKTTGGPVTGGWNIWSNGYIEDTITFPRSGTYEFEMVARGSIAAGVWPNMQLRLDQVSKADTTVNSTTWKSFIKQVSVTAGSRKVAIAFTNDFKNATEDRNLYVDKVIIREIVALPPAAPTLNAPVAGDSKVDLSWNIVANATGYKLKYGTTSGTYTTTLDVGNVTGYQIGSLTNGTKYYFVVSAYNTGGESANSNELSAIPLAPQPVVFISDTDYNASGQITKIEYGNGNVTTYTYDPLTLRVNNLHTVTAQGAVIQDLSYAYDSAGNILTITDGVNTASQTFQYDELNRLVLAQGNYGTRVYGYDPIGNMILKDGVNYYYGENAAGPHAVTSASDGSVFSYDQNGNMIKMTKGGIVWDYMYDAENRLKEVKKAATTQAKFEYDGDGGRTKKIAYSYSSSSTNPLMDAQIFPELSKKYNLFNLGDYVDYTKKLFHELVSLREAEAALSGTQGTTTTVTTATTKFIGSLFEETNSSPTSHIFLGDTRVASVNNGKVMYFHSDHLGGTNLLSDSTGVIKELMEYEPYGSFSRHEKYGTPQEVAQFYFTGKQFDENTGLYFYNARYYDPTVGRFITPDIFVQDSYDSQNLNRYVYVRNNPVNLTDPSGHFWFFAAAAALFKAASAYAIAHPIIAGAVVGGVLGGVNSAIAGTNIGMGIGLGMIGGGIGGAVGLGVGDFLNGAIGNFWAGMAGAGLGGATAGAATTGILNGDVGLGALAGFAGGVVAFGGARVWPLGADAVAGGVSSVIQGGKFGEGAKYGAIDNAITTTMDLVMPLETAGNQEKQPGDLVFIKPGKMDLVGWGISFLEGGAFSHVGVVVDNQNMVSAGPQKGVGYQKLDNYNNHQARVNSRFRGNQNVINAAKSLTVSKTTYGFLPNQRVCSTTCGSAISRGTGQWWTGIGPNSQYQTFKSYGE